MASKCIGKRDEEIFVGNTDGACEHLASLQTVRFGQVALDIDGNPLPARFRPIFINSSEHDAHERIRMAQLHAIIRGEE